MQRHRSCEVVQVSSTSMGKNSRRPTKMRRQIRKALSKVSCQIIRRFETLPFLVRVTTNQLSFNKFSLSSVPALSYLQTNLAAFVFRQFTCGDEKSFIGPQDEGGNMKWISASQAIFVNYKELRYGTR